MHKLIKILALAILLSPVAIFAQSDESVFSAFQKYVDVDGVEITTPTIVEVPLNTEVWNTQVAVYNVSGEKFEPFLFAHKTTYDKPLSTSARMESGDAKSIIDGDNDTTTEFPFSNRTVNSETLTFTFDEAITSTGFRVLLDQYVALPLTVEVSAFVDASPKMVVARQRMAGGTLRFPETTAKVWNVTFTYSQPLRIAELDFLQFAESTLSHNGSVRFLAQPDSTYRIYYDADRAVSVSTSERPNLSGNEFITTTTGSSVVNPKFVIADIDKDGVPDINDNCVRTANSDQADVNNNGRGDVCDDFDFDGVINLNDNCVNDPNRSQADEDGDGIGDVCDGEESRLTEKSPWIAWVGIITVAIVLIGLIALVLRDQRRLESVQGDAEEDGNTSPPIKPESLQEETNSEVQEKD